MKTAITVLFLLFCFTNTQAQSFEQGPGGPTDTINKMDHRGYKQGKWLLRNPGYGSLTLEKGYYLNNRKEGVWEQYCKNGKLRNKVTYVNGMLEGAAAFYNTDGKVLKEGKFKANKWINN